MEDIDIEFMDQFPLEYFKENKDAAGFGDSLESLYTTVRELVENALDSAESTSQHPRVEIKIEEIDQTRYDSIVELTKIERSADAGYQRLQKHRDILTEKPLYHKIEEKDAAFGNRFYKVTCEDNGKGMLREDIEEFGRVFSATEKHGLKQTRARFPLGMKMALMWSQLSTGLRIQICSSTKTQDLATLCKLDIDLYEDKPNCHPEERKKEKGWHGTEIQMYIQGNWRVYGPYVEKYMRQIAVIAPYAEFDFKFVSKDKNVNEYFPRKMEKMPEGPKHSPAVDEQLIKRLIDENSEERLLKFLRCEFFGITKSDAKSLIGKMGRDPEKHRALPVGELTNNEIACILKWLENKFENPSENCLDPVGKDNLYLGIDKTLEPLLVATDSGSVEIYEGHPFIVEAGVCLGGKYCEPGINIFRYANRAPLVPGKDGDVVTAAIFGSFPSKWDDYKIDDWKDKIGIFVSIVGTKIPFGGVANDYISAKASVIRYAVTTCIENCLCELKPKIMEKKEEAKQRKKEVRDKAKQEKKEARDEVECGGQLEASSVRNNHQAAPPAKQQQKRKPKLIRPSPGFRIKDLPKNRVTYWKMKATVEAAQEAAQKLVSDAQKLASVVQILGGKKRRRGESSGCK